MSRPDQCNDHGAKSQSPLKVIGAGFLATTAVRTTVTVAAAGRTASSADKVTPTVHARFNELDAMTIQASRRSDEAN